MLTLSGIDWSRKKPSDCNHNVNALLCTNQNYCDVSLFLPLIFNFPFVTGAAVAEWLSSWLAEQEDRGSIPGLATWIFRDWLSPASKSRYGWKIAKSTLILKNNQQQQPFVTFSLMLSKGAYSWIWDDITWFPKYFWQMTIARSEDINKDDTSILNLFKKFFSFCKHFGTVLTEEIRIAKCYTEVFVMPNH